MEEPGGGPNLLGRPHPQGPACLLLPGAGRWTGQSPTASSPRSPASCSVRWLPLGRCLEMHRAQADLWGQPRFLSSARWGCGVACPVPLPTSPSLTRLPLWVQPRLLSQPRPGAVSARPGTPLFHVHSRDDSTSLPLRLPSSFCRSVLPPGFPSAAPPLSCPASAQVGLSCLWSARWFCQLACLLEARPRRPSSSAPEALVQSAPAARGLSARGFPTGRPPPPPPQDCSWPRSGRGSPLCPF